jgi:hypothetical protein
VSEDHPMKETPKAAKAFEEYCAMEDRSLRKLEDKTGTKLSQLGVWSREHNWQERIKVYDAEQVEKERVERQKAIQKMNQRHAMIGTTQQAKAIQQIEELIAAKKFGSQATVQLLKLATDLERLARGAATERSEVTGKDGGPIKVENRDYSKFTNEELAILEQLAQKASDGGS